MVGLDTFKSHVTLNGIMLFLLIFISGFVGHIYLGNITHMSIHDDFFSLTGKKLMYGKLRLT